MIEKCASKELINRIIEYIGDEYKVIPYLYANVIKYGCGTENINTYIDFDTDKIAGVYMLYYDCMHFFTRQNSEYSEEVFVDMVNQLQPKVIMVQSTWGDRVESLLSNRKLERNYVIDMDSVGTEGKQYRSEIAKREDIEQIVQLLLGDKEYKDVYDEEVLRKQLLDRFDGGFSRYFVIKEQEKVVATCSTYGEVEGFALVGGVIVHPEFRRRGYASDVEEFACNILSKENISKVGFVNYNNEKSLLLHEKLGAKAIGALYKFVREE